VVAEAVGSKPSAGGIPGYYGNNREFFAVSAFPGSRGRRSGRNFSHLRVNSRPEITGNFVRHIWELFWRIREMGCGSGIGVRCIYAPRLRQRFRRRCALPASDPHPRPRFRQHAASMGKDSERSIAAVASLDSWMILMPAIDEPWRSWSFLGLRTDLPSTSNLYIRPSSSLAHQHCSSGLLPYSL
jgi:hypothetical protein